jgi:dolichyl-phosphate-mannose-protein mannosyltransferase
VWALAPQADPHTIARLLTVPVLVGLLIVSLRVEKAIVDQDERWVIGVTGLVYVLGLGRSVWSLSPANELFHGTISRTLDVGDRPDSRISFFVTTLVGHGYRPFSAVSRLLFYPYSFSDRGPLPGVVSAPTGLISGTTPPLRFPNQVWYPFDPQGFMVYRLVMMLLAVWAILAVYSLAARAAGAVAGRLAVLIAAGAPFVVHDVYFTWPKFAAAAMCLLAAYLVLNRRPLWAGLFLGLGYLMHPLALLSVPTLLLLILLVLSRRRPTLKFLADLAGSYIAFGVGLGTVWASWRIVQGRHYTQDRFLIYVRMAANVKNVPLSQWISTRWASVENTLIPLRLPLADSGNRGINAVAPGRFGTLRLHSDWLVHFSFQYWNTLPFGVGIIFFPALLILMWRIMRRRPYLFVAVAVVPFLVFAVYWGSFTSGLMREGLHVWLLTLFILAGVQLKDDLHRPQFTLFVTAALLLRLVEVTAMMTVPSVLGARTVISAKWAVTDVTALSLMIAAVVGLAVLSVSEIRRRAASPGGIRSAAQPLASAA